jgi:plasmid stabilization system protein ParE
MTPLLVRPEAELEVDEAYQWYKQRSEELAEEFVDLLGRCFLDIQENPLGYPKFHKNARRLVMTKFPYNIIYMLEEGLLEDGSFGETIIVFAVAHARRNPRSWQRRLT